MIWSKQELENLALGGAEVTRERVMKHLSAPENADIFAAENFSYLWGALGVAGAKGLDAATCRKIWQALCDNGAADAFDKGILGDYNRALAAKYKDNRMRAWQGLNNFQAGVKFRKSILEKLARRDEQLAAEAAPLLFDYRKMGERLNSHKLDAGLKNYLEKVRGLSASCGISGDAVRAVYEKIMILRTLCDVAAYTPRGLDEDEKDYLFRYLREAVLDGFALRDIGLDDMVLSKLMAGSAAADASELEREPLLSRNAEIEEFAAGFEETEGFFEEVAAQYVRADPGKAQELTARCLKLIEKGAYPCGVVFALALLELRQAKSAVKILLALAQKGRAIEMASFLHRLLPQAKGAETLVADILRVNLQRLPATAGFMRDYVRRRTLLAVRDFIENDCPQPGATLLKYLAAEHRDWLVKNALKDYIALGNALIATDKTQAKAIAEQARGLGLNIYEADDCLFIGTAEDNPLTAARRRLEKNVLGATTFDISAATGKMSGLEGAAYQFYHNLKGAWRRRKENNTAGQAAKEEVIQTGGAAMAYAGDGADVAAASGVADVGVADTADMRADVGGLVAGDEADVAAAGDEAGADSMAAAGAEQAGNPTVKLPAFEEWNEGAAKTVPFGQAPTITLAEEKGFELPDEVLEISSQENYGGDLMPETEPAASGEEPAGYGEAAAVSGEEPAVYGNDVGSQAGAAGETGDMIVGAVAAEAGVVSLQAEAAADGAGEIAVQAEVSQEAVSTAGSELMGSEADKLPAFEEWDSGAADSNAGEHKNKININSILNINPKEVDKHFEKIKQLTAAAVQQAKNKVEHSGLSHSPAVEKAKTLLGRFLKKK